MSECPCCRQSVRTSPIDVLVKDREIDAVSERVLRAVWRGKGMPVQSSEIFDEIYADDANGGPAPCQMYSTMNRALRTLREKLEGSGVAIVPVGHRKGHRLAITGGADRV